MIGKARKSLLLMGALAAWWYRRDDSARGLAVPVAREAAAIVGLVCVGYGLAAVHLKETVPNAWTLLPTAGTAVLLSAGPSIRVSGWVLDFKPFVGLGLVSYPLYLWHWPLLVFSQEMMDHPSSASVRLGVLGASLGLAITTVSVADRAIQRNRSRPGARRIVRLQAGPGPSMTWVTWPWEASTGSIGAPRRASRSAASNVCWLGGRSAISSR